MLTVSQIKAKITGIRTSANNLRGNLQEVLMNLAAHVYIHGDTRPVEAEFKRLLDGSLQGVDIGAVVKYMAKHCFVHVKEDGSVVLNKKARNEADFDKEDGNHLIKYLTDEVPHWYTYTKSTADAVKDLDPAARLRSLAKQVADAKKYKLKFSPSDFKSAASELAEAIDARMRNDRIARAEVAEVAAGRAAEEHEALTGIKEQAEAA